MSKRKEEKALQYKNEIEGLRNMQEAALRRIDSRVAEVEKLADPVEKIAGLHDLLLRIHNAKKNIFYERNRIVSERTHSETHGMKVWRLLDPFGKDKQEAKAKTQLMIHEKLGDHDFLDSQRTHVLKMLDETQKNCDLKEVSESPMFPDAASLKDFLDRHKTLRDRFVIAAFKAAVATPGKELPPSSGPKPPRV